MSRFEAMQDETGMLVVNVPGSEIPDFEPVVAETEGYHSHQLDQVGIENERFDLLASANDEYQEIIDRVDGFKDNFSNALDGKPIRDIGQMVLIKRDGGGSDVFTVELLTSSKVHSRHKEGIAFSIIDSTCKKTGRRRIIGEMHKFTHESGHASNKAHRPEPIDFNNHFGLLENVVDLACKRSSRNATPSDERDYMIDSFNTIGNNYRQAVTGLGKIALSVK